MLHILRSPSNTDSMFRIALSDVLYVLIFRSSCQIIIVKSWLSVKDKLETARRTAYRVYTRFQNLAPRLVSMWWRTLRCVVAGAMLFEWNLKKVFRIAAGTIGHAVPACRPFLPVYIGSAFCCTRSDAILVHTWATGSFAFPWCWTFSYPSGIKNTLCAALMAAVSQVIAAAVSPVVVVGTSTATTGSAGSL